MVTKKKIIEVALVDQAIEGRHYSGAVRSNLEKK